MDLEELVKSYLWVLKVEKRLALNSLKSYEYDFKIFLNWLEIGKVDVFKEDLVLNYYEYLKIEKGNLENSILRKLNLIIALFKYCNEEKGCKFFIPERKNKKLARTYRTFMESEDLEKIRNYLSKNMKSNRLLAIVEILYSTGLRVSELLKLKTIDINEIKKNRSLQIIGKGRVKRIVFFNDLALEAIDKYLQEFNKKNISGLLFPVTRQRVFQLLKQLAHELNIDLDKIFPHSFRHRLLTDLVQKGMNLVNIQRIAGHKQIATTEKYTHVEDYLYEEIYKYHPLIKKIMG